MARRPSLAGFRAPFRPVVSCGGVLFRHDAQERVEFLLVGRRHPHMWALPKGTPIGDETPEQTALREVEEETGVRGRVVTLIGSITYSFAVPPRRRRYQKTVHHYLLAPLSGDPSFHDAEYDFVQWMPAAEAIHALSYENERVILRNALRLLEEHTPAQHT